MSIFDDARAASSSGQSATPVKPSTRSVFDDVNAQLESFKQGIAQRMDKFALDSGQVLNVTNLPSMDFDRDMALRAPESIRRRAANALTTQDEAFYSPGFVRNDGSFHLGYYPENLTRDLAEVNEWDPQQYQQLVQDPALTPYLTNDMMIEAQKMTPKYTQGIYGAAQAMDPFFGAIRDWQNRPQDSRPMWQRINNAVGIKDWYTSDQEQWDEDMKKGGL